MPQFIKNFNLLIFMNGESERYCCPVCGAELDFQSRIQASEKLQEGWRCPSCGTCGKQISSIRFERHEVTAATVPLRERLELTSDRAVCLNGEILAGSAVLAADNSGLPSMPGVVTAIEIPDEEAPENVDVHVDFTGQYPPDRAADIETRFTMSTGYFRPFESLDLSDQILQPDQLLSLGQISDLDLASIMETEENAVRYSCRLLREQLAQSGQREID